MMNFKVFLTTVAHLRKMKRISLKTHMGMYNYGKNLMLWGCARPNGISHCIVNSRLVLNL